MKAKVTPFMSVQAQTWEGCIDPTHWQSFAPEGVDCEYQGSTALPPRKTQYPLYKKLGADLDRRGKSPPDWVSNPEPSNRPTRSESLHQLPYPDRLSNGWWQSFIHSAVCLMTGPMPPPKRFLHIVRFKGSSFIWHYPLPSLRSSSNFLRLLPLLLDRTQKIGWTFGVVFSTFFEVSNFLDRVYLCQYVVRTSTVCAVEVSVSYTKNESVLT